MIVSASPASKEKLAHLAKAKTLHVRTGNNSGEIYKTDTETENALLPLSGSQFTVLSLAIQGERGKSSNRTNAEGQKYSVATGTTEVLCKTEIKHDASGKSFVLRMKLGEVANVDTTGKITLLFERIGRKVNAANEVTEAGQFWAHAETGATIEQQERVIGLAITTDTAPAAPPKVKI